MVTNRLMRTLSAFNPSTRMWTPIPSRNAQSQVAQRPSLTSRKIDTSWTQSLLSHILEGPKSPDIIFLQEVTPNVRAALLEDARAFLVTDAEDQTSFEGVPFATMTLLSSARFASGAESQEEGDGIGGGGKFTLGCVSRVTLPSKYGRDGLCVDIIPPTAAPGTVFRLINVHLDSLWYTLPFRAQQMKILADVLREPGCSGGIIAGDFNAISPEDEGLVDKNDLVDAWVALHGRAGPRGGTAGQVGQVAMMGLKAEEMEVIRPGRIEVPRPGGESDENLGATIAG
ncbi:hypothetical protein BJV77DRAFT_1000439 [Russula vinacea]|nr:hypothetical protein BJV77DRAFT_1000439 [Russula vinacea]